MYTEISERLPLWPKRPNYRTVASSRSHVGIHFSRQFHPLQDWSLTITHAEVNRAWEREIPTKTQAERGVRRGGAGVVPVLVRVIRFQEDHEECKQPPLLRDGTDFIWTINKERHWCCGCFWMPFAICEEIYRSVILFIRWDIFAGFKNITSIFFNTLYSAVHYAPLGL